ncbi:STAS domain-containing protein [Pedobacter psychroterrae]|uniref:Anti-sigma factor antagonist n=1 Tax=Pedobacter psychroterrae TaxID=2530453 RepID=A0A4R0NP01_9SPHI|nr:STAS domain-containing protein [Pedobacter psychroterrae]TCD01708.1 anti-sigma factor antagonist [Pedobacter psychroterrae]
MDVEKENFSDVMVLTLVAKDANLSRSDIFKEYVFEEIESGESNIVISFENVEYLDSSFLGALVAILKKLTPIGGKLVLVELNNDIQNLFELTRLDKIFIIRNSVDSAYIEFKK